MNPDMVDDFLEWCALNDMNPMSYEVLRLFDEREFIKDPIEED
jgi:hypothetical protein